jgi:hypothetical protein
MDSEGHENSTNRSHDSCSNLYHALQDEAKENANAD